MINFGDIIPEVSTEKVNFNSLIGKPPKLPKQELKLMEPGNKIPIANYQQIGQWCEVCEDVTAHVRNPEKKMLRCLKCKTKTSHK